MQLHKFFFFVYRAIFCRPRFYSFNEHVYKLTLRSLGVLNSETASATGEENLLDHLKNDSSIKRVFDVGANTDTYGPKYFTDAKIYAFEPHPQTFKQLKKKFNKNANVFCYQNAISSKNSTALLWDFAQDSEKKSSQPTSQLASLNKKVIEHLHLQKAESYKVKTLTLDSFVKKEKIDSIDFLKIDVEGHELEVLKGAKKLISKKKLGFVQFEFNEMNVYSRSFLLDFIEILPNHDFYRILPKKLYPIKNYRPVLHEIFAFQNILAVPKNKTSIIQKCIE